MAARREIEAHEGVARLHQREEHALIGLAAGIRLHIGEAAVEQLAGALDRELLGDVDELAAAIIAPARIALGVFVGHHRALRLEHGARDDVLRGDELDLVALAAESRARSRARSRDRRRRAAAEKNEFERSGWAVTFMGRTFRNRAWSGDLRSHAISTGRPPGKSAGRSAEG